MKQISQNMILILNTHFEASHIQRVKELLYTFVMLYTITVSIRLDPDQARIRVFLPDLGPNCLQRLWADDTSR